MESSRALPSGVVTFLMTDIQGSTRQWEREPEAMRAALSRHDAILAQAIRGRNGHVVKSKGEGDSVFAVFPHGRDAVGAAMFAQFALAVEEWATSTPLLVRMAIHTGQIELRDGDYSGPTVNRCARLRALAEGGQILLSGVTAQLTQRQLPGGASLKDLGTQSLKDLAAPERVWQLVHPHMPLAGVIGSQTVGEAPPTAPNHTAYLLTDHLNRCGDGRLWNAGVKHAIAGTGARGYSSVIRGYASAALAVLLNGQNERFRQPRLWEATVDVEVGQRDAVVDCREMTAIRQVAAATLSPHQVAHFAVECARAAYAGASHATAFGAWADSWLLGQDSSGHNARALADELEGDPRRGAELPTPGDLMAANAARAAMHTARVSFLAGRAREEEIARGIELANEAVHTALRMAHLDLVGLAERVLPNATGRSAPRRPPSGAGSDRILRAMPT